MNAFGKGLLETLEGIAMRWDVFHLGEFPQHQPVWYENADLEINGCIEGKEFGLAFIQEGLRRMQHTPGAHVKIPAFGAAMAALNMKKLVGTIRYHGALFIDPDRGAPLAQGDIAVTRMGHPAVVTCEEYIATRGIRSFRVLEAITGPNGERQGSTLRRHVRRTQDVRYFIRLCGEFR